MSNRNGISPQDAWRKLNPLRQYRDRSGLTQSDVSVYLDVSTTTIQHWEAGSVQPDQDNLRKIGILMKSPDIARAWSAWYESRPRLAAV